jgi:hypothetical protein
MGALFLPLGPSLTAAEAMLLQAPLDSERGSAIVRCSHYGLSGLLGEQDNYTIRYASGDLYRCRVRPPAMRPSSRQLATVHSDTEVYVERSD